MALQHRNDPPGPAVLPAPENSKRGWSEREDDIMRAEYRPGRAAYLAATLGRSADSVHNRAKRLGLTAPRRYLSDVRRETTPPAPLPSPALVVELAESRMEADALRVLLALSRGYLSEDEAGRALGVSADRRARGGGQPPWASPLEMHTLEQAARGMDLASRRIGGGGVIGDMHEASLRALRIGRGAGGAG